MKEDFLHYVWKFKKFDFLAAKTTTGENVQLLYGGQHNQNAAGPDFFNAKLKIGTQLWAGNVEIHLKASDWYAHYHETDPNYDNVILHVVWEDDVEVFRKDNTAIPCLRLKDFVFKNALDNYHKLLLNNQQYINCKSDFSSVDKFLLENWLERLYVERLQRKSKNIQQLLAESQNNWEAVLFQTLAKNFGLNKNGAAFLAIAKSIPFTVIQKIKNNETLEALLMGQGGMLEKNLEDAYYQKLQKEYLYLQHKYKLKQPSGLAVHYFRLRPHNFPTIRLSQLANLYVNIPSLFSKIQKATTKKSFYELLEIEASDYWKTHYTFGKEGKKSKKILSKNFKDLLLINTLVPVLFAYYQSLGKQQPEKLFDLMRSLKAEQNAIVKKFNTIRKNTATTALASQAILELKPNFCDLNRCLECAIGLKLLQK